MKKISTALSAARREYEGVELSESKVHKNPFIQFERWMDEAIRSRKVADPTAFTIATVDEDGVPSARIMLLKGLDKTGFVFYTNYKSHKAADLSGNKWCCINFFWPELNRQVRITGRVEKVSTKESDIYFASRPRESALGAWTSNQSSVLKNRDELEERFAFYVEKFSGKPIPRPSFWGGYRLMPVTIEFWQGRERRLHDRILFTRSSKGWKLERLSP